MLRHRNMSSVVLHGGAGNQLFQWAFGHFLTTNGIQTSYVFFEKPYLIAHASNSIGSFVKSCSHGEFKSVGLSSNKILRLLQDPSNPKSPKRLIPGLVSDTTADPFYSKKANYRYLYNLGYFQNKDLVLSVLDLVIPELLESLSSQLSITSEFERQYYGAQVIHVRQGDTMTRQNMARVGVLSAEYYKTITKRSGISNIVVTDDVQGAKKIVNNNKIDAFLGPEELDVAATLRVMSKALTLYAANSTLAWWGGVLAKHNGADVHIPEPFFLNVSPKPGNAFHFPSFKLIDSKFIGLAENV